jgi:hypothetical protein
MTLKLTPELLRSVYDMIVQTDTKFWAAMPASKNLKFAVVKSQAFYAETDGEVLRVSEAKNGHIDSVIISVAHEMVHVLRQKKGFSDWDRHGAAFNKMARRVSKRCGFDPKSF